MELNILKDDRVDCFSVLTNMKTIDFLEFVEKTHQNRGGIEGQRDTLKTSTAKRIRSRMIRDLQKRAILPPIVVGAIVSEANFLR